MYSNAKYISVDGKNVCVSVEIAGDRWTVPIDPKNSDYANIMKLVRDGELVIAEADA